MKPSVRVRRRSIVSPIAILVASAGSLLLTAHLARATPLTWDVDGASGVPIGGTGAWDTTSSFWDNAGVLQPWVNANVDSAIFDGTPGTVTLGAGITVGNITFNTAGYTVTSNTLTLGAATNTITTNADATIASVVDGATGLIKAGNGILTLSGANTVAGQMIVSAGTLKAGNAGALGAAGVGNETVIQSGATLDVNGQILTPTEIVQIAGNGVGGNGAIVNSGAAQQNALNKVVLTADASVGGINRFDIRNGVNPALDLGGFTLTKVGASQFSIVSATVTSGNIVINGGILSIEATSLVQGTGTITVGAAGTLGMYANTAANFTRDIVLNGGAISNLGNDGGLNSNISLGATSTLTGTATSTLNGIISGNGGLMKTGTGTFILTGNNTYSGGTAISGGILRVATTAALPGYNTGSVTVSNGGTLGVSVSGVGAWTAADIDTLRGSAFFSGGSALGIETGGGDFTYASDIAGDLGLAKLGANTLTLSGTNTYLGTTTIGGGTLALASGTGHLPTGTNLTFTGTGTLDLAGTTQALGILAVNGTTTAAINGTYRTTSITFDGTTANNVLTGGTLDLNGNPLSINAAAAGVTTGRDRTISSPIVGSAALTIAANGDTTDTGGGGSSEFNLTGANTFTGAVTITAGLVSVGSNFGDAANVVTLQGGGLVQNAAGTVTMTRKVVLGGTGDDFLRVYSPNELVFNNALTGTGNLHKTDTGTLTLNGANTYTGTTIVGGGTLLLGSTGSLAGTTGIRIQGGTFTNQGTVTITGTGVNDDAGAGYSLSVLNGQTLNQSGTLSVVNFGGNGTTNVSNGTMNVSGLFYLGEQTAATVRAFNVTGGVVNLTTPTGNAIRIGHWNGGATTVTVSGGTLDASASLSNWNLGWDGAATMTVGGGATLATFKARGIQLDANGDSATYNDTLTISANGLVEVGVNGMAGASANDKLILNGGTVRGVANSTWSEQITANDSTTSTVDVNPVVTVTQSGIINNTAAGTINKTGNGTLVLSNAANTFAGTLNLNGGVTNVSGTFSAAVTMNANAGGTLLVTGATALTGAGLVNVNSGGILGGTGTLATTSTVTVNAGGAVAPGASGAPGFVGTLNVGNLTATAGELRVDLNATTTTTGGGTNDLLNITGTANLGGVAILPLFSAAPTSGNTYTILTSTNAPTGAAVLSNLASAANSSLVFTLGTSGNSTTLNVTGAARNLTWNGDGAANAWDLNTATNWQQAAAHDATFKSYDNVTFDDSSANKTVAMNGMLVPIAVTVNNSAGDYTFAGTGGVQGGTLTKQGTGKLTITSENAFAGATTISAGTVQIGAGGTTGSIGNANITNNGVLDYNRSDAVAYTGIIGGTGSLTKDGAGSLTLSTLNTYTGGTTVNAGNLILTTSGGTGAIRGALTINAGGTVTTANTDSLGYNAGAQVATINVNGGTLNNAVGGNQAYRTSISLTGGTVSATGGGAFNFTTGFGVASNASSTTSVFSAPIVIRDSQNMSFTVAAGTTPSGVDLNVSGVLSGASGAITKSGNGTMVLAGVSTYTGATTVAAGTLLVNGNINPSATTINGATAILGGSGTVGVTTLTTGTLTAGSNGIGTLNTGNLALNGGTALFQLGATTSDTLNTTGTVTFGGNVELSLSFNSDLAEGTNYTLVRNDLADAFAFTSGGFALGGTPIGSGAVFNYTSGAFNEAFQLSYTGGDGNDAVLTVVPEPGTALSLLGGLGLLLAAKRRRRS